MQYVTNYNSKLKEQAKKKKEAKIQPKIRKNDKMMITTVGRFVKDFPGIKHSAVSATVLTRHLIQGIGINTNCPLRK